MGFVLGEKAFSLGGERPRPCRSAYASALYMRARRHTEREREREREGQSKFLAAVSSAGMRCSGNIPSPLEGLHRTVVLACPRPPIRPRTGGWSAPEDRGVPQSRGQQSRLEGLERQRTNAMGEGGWCCAACSRNLAHRQSMDAG
jgi:hypothetical protein